MKMIRLIFVIFGAALLAIGLLWLATSRLSQPVSPVAMSPVDHASTSEAQAGLPVEPSTLPTTSTSPSSSPTELSSRASGWNIDDFHLAIAQDVSGSFPAALPVYRLGFITDPSGLKTEVGATEAAALADALGVPGPVREVYFSNDIQHKQPHWFAGEGNPDELDYEWENPSSSSFSGPALDIDALSGYFQYESRNRCGVQRHISLQQAEDSAQQFLEDHALDLGESTTTASYGVARVPGHAGCYNVSFSNLSAVRLNNSDTSAVLRLIPDSAYGFNGLADPSTDLGGTYLTAVVDPDTGEVVTIGAYYLKFNLLGYFPVKTLQQVETDISMSRGVSIPADINPLVEDLEESLVIFPRDNEGKIQGTIKRIYPVYTVKPKDPDHRRFMGDTIEPWDFALVDVANAYVPSEQLTIPDYYILLQLPAIKS